MNDEENATVFCIPLSKSECPSLIFIHSVSPFFLSLFLSHGSLPAEATSCQLLHYTGSTVADLI